MTVAKFKPLHSHTKSGELLKIEPATRQLDQLILELYIFPYSHVSWNHVINGAHIMEVRDQLTAQRISVNRT